MKCHVAERKPFQAAASGSAKNGLKYKQIFLLENPKAEQASRIHLRVSFSLDLFIFACTSVQFWNYRWQLPFGNISSLLQHYAVGYKEATNGK